MQMLKNLTIITGNRAEIHANADELVGHIQEGKFLGYARD
jgi:hypothetical protein